MPTSKMKTALGLAVAALVGGGAVYGFQLVKAHERGSNEMLVDATSPSAKATTNPKQLWTCGMHPQVIQDHPGLCPICHMKLTPLKDDSDGSSAPGGQRKILYYWDPMLGPSSIARAPGKSAMGMDLVPVFEDEHSAGPRVKIDPTIVQNMGIRTAEVTRGPLSFTVRAFGMLEVPEPMVFEINLKMNGWIQKLQANTEGMHIQKGDPLFDLYSPDIQIAEQELIGAIAAAKGLDSNAPDAVRVESQTMINSAKQKLSLWGIAEQDISAIADAKTAPRTVPFRSPADGDLVEKMVVEGSAVQAGMKLMRIEDHSKLWLNVQVYEDQIPLINLGQMVEATVDGYGGKTFSGPVMFIHPHIDHMTRTITVRVALDNPKHEIHPGMYATAKIITNPIADAVLVPREAVIDTGTRQIVFVAEPDGHFDPRKVRMGLAGDDDQVEILEGLAPGETVVTSGQFLLDVESRTAEAIEKLRQASGDPMPYSTAGAMVGMDSSSKSMAATMPAVASNALVIAHCPMKNADWLQVGSDISNPYYGTAMSTCGSVVKIVAAPRAGTPLGEVSQSYLLLSKAFDSDTLDAGAVETLKNSVTKLSGNQFSGLNQAVDDLSNKKDLNSARTTFTAVSAELIRLLENP